MKLSLFLLSIVFSVVALAAAKVDAPKCPNLVGTYEDEDGFTQFGINQDAARTKFGVTQATRANTDLPAFAAPVYWLVDGAYRNNADEEGTGLINVCENGAVVHKTVKGGVNNPRKYVVESWGLDKDGNLLVTTILYDDSGKEIEPRAINSYNRVKKTPYLKFNF